jgi:hypothetical protein
MSHEIHLDELKKTHSFVSYGQPAWHNLGKVVDSALTAEDCIKYANLDYEVDKTTIHAQIDVAESEGIGGRIYKQVPERYATYRTDTNEVLGIVGQRYEIVQNKDAFTKSQAGGWKYDILFAGLKVNMPDVCAAIGLAQIKKYAIELIKERERIARAYNNFFSKFLPPLFEYFPLYPKFFLPDH